jgi:hypothetical protein
MMMTRRCLLTSGINLAALGVLPAALGTHGDAAVDRMPRRGERRGYRIYLNGEELTQRGDLGCYEACASEGWIDFLVPKGWSGGGLPRVDGGVVAENLLMVRIGKNRRAPAIYRHYGHVRIEKLS